MAKKNQIFIDVVIDDKGTTKRVAVDAKKLGVELDKSGAATEKNTKNTEKLSKSNKDLDRNLRGTAKMTSNGTKEFSKMQQGMGGLVGAYATLAAQIFAVSAAFQFLSNASQITNLIEGQRAMGNVTGVAYGTITDRVIEATDAQLKYGDAARAAAIGTAAGLQAGQLTELANAAKNASFALGRDLTDSFNRLIRGVTKAEPELLDELGIILRLETATEKYAQSIGKSRTELNEYERTQAVTNEVLEQAQRKFAAIEAQMDPNAAALAQFAKSFDDLVRGFQEMVITGLRPVLQFLSKNTVALTAALALFAIPIIKAILPSLDDWEKSTKKLAKRNSRFFKLYKKGLKDSGDELNTFIKSQKAMEKSATKTARKVLKGTESSAGIDFLRGEGKSGDRRKQAAARKIIENALEQTKAGKDAETGYLKGKNREQVLDLQKSYNARVAMAKAANKKTIFSFDFAFGVIKGGILGVQTAWQGAMVFMVNAARVASIAINLAFKATAVIGVLTLIFEAGKALFRFFVPLSEEQKRQNAIVDELGDSYDKLAQQMAGARKARESLIAGSDRQINIGNILASADVDNVIAGINKITQLDPDSSSYEKLKKDLLSVTMELGRIDPKFKTLNENLEKGTTVTAEQRKAVRDLASEYIDLGVRIADVPNKIKKANEAFASLAKSINNTPLSNLVDNTFDALEGLDLRIENSAKTLKSLLDEQTKALQNQIKILELEDKSVKFISKDFLNIYSNENLEKLEKLKESSDFRDDEQLKALVDTIKATFDLIKTDKQLKKDLKIRYDFALVREQEILKLRQESLKVSIADAKRRAQGNDVYARIINLEEERNKKAQKIVKAQEAVIAAETALFGATGEQLKTAQENEIAARLNLQLVKAEIDFELKVLDTKEKQLDVEQRMLNLSMRQQALDKSSGELQRGLDFSKATGAGTEESLTNQRLLQRKLLENAVEGAKLEVQKREEARNLAEKTIRQNTRAAGGNLTIEDMFEGTRQLSPAEISAKLRQREDEAVAGSPEGRGLVQAQQALKNAENLLNIDKNKLLTFKNQNKEMVEQANKQLQIVGFTQAHVLFNERVLEAKKIGKELTEDELALLKQQSIATVMLTEIAAQKQQLFFSIGDSIAGAFTSIIDGSMSAKDAFKQMAKSIISDIISMVVRLTVMRALMSFIPFSGPAPLNYGSSMSTGTFRNGGIFEQPKGYRMGGKVKDYSTGGIARGPDHGYPAVLHGREAVVPLPSGDSIPVELNGAGGQQNNVTVNVTMNGDGTSSSNTEADGTSRASNIGKMVARAVQDELMEQKRAGGILSPYGVA